MEEISIQALLKAPLHNFQPEDWAEWYPRVAELLELDDASLRAAAVVRLAMAAFWAEHSRPPGSREATADAARRRAAWLIGVVDQSSHRHSDVLLSFLKQLRFKGDAPPFPEVILPWLHTLLKRRPTGVPLDHIEGAIVLIGGLEPWEGSRLPPILDHPSDHVRACAAQMLARGGYGDSKDDDGLFDPDFVAELTAKELARPGIAGPFWSGAGLSQSDLDGLGFDPVEWMLGIIERRNDPEPDDLPFNGIDFHVHELAAFDPSAVRRLIAAERTALALMTAIEIRDEVEGMAPVLSELADHRDPGFSIPAQIHLANYYRLLHPRADPDRIRHLPDWRDGVEVFVLRYGEPGRYTNKVVIFPEKGEVFDDAGASAIIDAAMPHELRGELARHYLPTCDEAPAPVRLGRDELRRYGSGAHIKLIGAKDRAGWRRIEISGDHLGARWRPWNWGGNVD